MIILIYGSSIIHNYGNLAMSDDRPFDLKEGMDKSTPTKEVSPNRILNAVYSKKQNKL